MDSIIGSIVDEKYRVLSLLGSGGLGSVYKAEQADLSRFVAIKFLHSTVLGDEEQLLRFEQEAKILAELDHKNIVRVFSYGRLASGIPYMVMEFLAGQGLDHILLAEKRLPWRRAVAIFEQICNAVAFAHSKGIIHRDLKPQNVMLLDRPEPDFVKILDFGLSRFLVNKNTAQRLTQTGTIIGSVHYMSPEVCQGGKADERSDVYSLACALYECLGGRTPIVSDNPISIISKHVSEMPPAFASLPDFEQRKMPKELELVVFKAMQKDPSERFQSMLEFGEALRLVREERTGDLKLGSVKVKGGNKSLAGWVVPVVMAGALIVLGAVILPVMMKEQRGKASVETEGQRARQQLKAKKYVEKAKLCKSQGNTRLACSLARRALLAIARDVPPPERSIEASKVDLEILTGVADVLATVKDAETFEGRSFEKVITNNGGLKGKDRGDFDAAIARLLAHYGELPSGMTSMLMALQVYAYQKEEKKSAMLVADMRAICKDKYEQGSEIEYFCQSMFDLGEAYTLSCKSDQAEARDYAVKMDGRLRKNLSKLMKKRCLQLLTQYGLLERDLGLYDLAEKTLLEAFKLSETVETTYAGMYFISAFDLVSVYEYKEDSKTAIAFLEKVELQEKKAGNLANVRAIRQKILSIIDSKKSGRSLREQYAQKWEFLHSVNP